jgi:hypothetical protein
MTTCHYHPDRSGIGVCMRCRVVICAACCTRVDGINHCHACLKKMGRHSTPPPRRRMGGVVAALGLLGLVWLFFLGVFWLIQGTFAP